MNDNYNAETVTIVGGPERKFPSLARVTHDRIGKLIEQFIGGAPSDMASLRGAASELKVLPLAPANDAQWFGVTADGDVLVFGLHSPYDPVEVDDVWLRATTLSKSLNKYPELEVLIPPPPLSCRTCPRCGGSGLITRSGREVLCICEGLGWLPSVEDEIQKEDKNKPASVAR